MQLYMYFSNPYCQSVMLTHHILWVTFWVCICYMRIRKCVLHLDREC